MYKLNEPISKLSCHTANCRNSWLQPAEKAGLARNFAITSLNFKIMQIISLLLLACVQAEELDLGLVWKENDFSKRVALLEQIQALADRTSADEFHAFDENTKLQTNNPLLKFYEQCLDKLMLQIPDEKVEDGSIAIWYLYNMGFVIKTPNSCFGLDIHHRNADRLEPLLDFLVVTHNHDDHYSIPLMTKMTKAGKPVLSNFFPNAYYTKAASMSYQFNGVTIHCGEADHNNKLKKFTMPVEIICQTGKQHFVFFSSGDCASHTFLDKKSEFIDLYAVHPRNIMVAREAASRLNAKTTFIVHLLEMGHEINRWRWPFSVGQAETRDFQQGKLQAWIPFWGEKYIWDGTGSLENRIISEGGFQLKTHKGR